MNMRIDRKVALLGHSRERAKELIKNGQVSVGGKVCTKPGMEVSESDDVAITGDTLKYAGRGGLKLEYALEHFKLGVKGFVCLDIGASTGGFSDCLLQHGALKVYAADVGHGQLAQKLRTDSRVINMEKTDIRRLLKLPEPVDFVCADVSFISLKHIFPEIYRFMRPGMTAVVLVKPQFEVGRNNLNKKGIVKDVRLIEKTVSDLKEFAEGLGFQVLGVCPSPIKGGDGNEEFLFVLTVTECSRRRA
ncbi:MAG: TlyA family RNA methyltransferase [Oscillospiraceae bacterium]|jgi:23S rRNA (cytidine1920-2'-O)/16S rRNA (cytidine1409-2'-O)-methyltransferase|nr:TlyA family RNA methyltransferase [Oscillospiraceae bacterium]